LSEPSHRESFTGTYLFWLWHFVRFHCRHDRAAIAFIVALVALWRLRAHFSRFLTWVELAHLLNRLCSLKPLNDRELTIFLVCVIRQEIASRHRPRATKPILQQSMCGEQFSWHFGRALRPFSALSFMH